MFVIKPQPLCPTRAHSCLARPTPPPSEHLSGFSPQLLHHLFIREKNSSSVIFLAATGESKNLLSEQMGAFEGTSVAAEKTPFCLIDGL